LLLVVDSPVDNELTPLCAVLMPDEAEVESEVSELFVLLRPLDSDRRGQRSDVAIGGRQPGGQRIDAALRGADAGRS
ncbi:hypothetical protein, partial [Burkholderia pseudomallei]|uniref:hypothetical protein n=1 Tax=Burkholderia pseudomallei TaxID=28450 RepID=UPI00217FE3BF